MCSLRTADIPGMRTGFRARVTVVVVVVLLGFCGYGAYRLYEHRGASEAARLAQQTTLPGDEVPCSEVSWAWAHQDSRCATSKKDATSVVEGFVAGLRASGVKRVESGCLDPGTPMASCTVEVKTSFQHSMLLIVQAHSDRPGQLSGADMWMTTRQA